MECQIGVISGDGIGPEIVTEAKKVLDQIGKKYGHSFHYTGYPDGCKCFRLMQPEFSFDGNVMPIAAERKARVMRILDEDVSEEDMLPHCPWYS